ncbi:FHA domain-containing protein [Ottowia sp.]|uniref:FHA domain-containing protein n=1 Tax=Ottowia sp. TaxID=1898956 RepID=UPI002B992308|nr:FHA domain-containing protein [Ottowia sp.]HOB67218.1 FHA domain-containing protein [Ottowia sp.]HPZ57714.1 FHA domain-containing protein [Ottowia sp.]HQD46426.1 FHA domain-containing protein [Ottowia sp.]
MPKLIVSIDGIVVKEVQLTQDRSTLGRRPYNDIVIDNLAVSGEHAVLQMADGQVTLEDLGSTNGTCVNGQAVQSHVLANDDVIEIGKYRIRFLDGEASARSLGDAAAEPRVAPAVLAAGSRPNQPDAAGGPRVRVVTGSSAGREMLLTKAVTTLGKPGVAVAAITRKPHGFDLAHVKGQYVASVNGVGTDAGPITLKNRDQIDLGGVRLEFIDG